MKKVNISNDLLYPNVANVSMFVRSSILEEYEKIENEISISRAIVLFIIKIKFNGIS